jgi:hypothetical protein
VVWANDASPATFPGGIASSGANSLNYNDGVDYDNGAINAGVAMSPSINLAGYTTPTLKFKCNFETENVAGYDVRKLRIYTVGVTTPVLDTQLLTTNVSSLVGDCSASGTWHEHTINLDPAWGTITVEFFFDTVDSYTNNKAGWAVDDLKVEGVGSSTAGSGGSVAGSSEASGSGGGGGGGKCGGSLVSNGKLPIASWTITLLGLLLSLACLRWGKKAV